MARSKRRCATSLHEVFEMNVAELLIGIALRQRRLGRGQSKRRTGGRDDHA